MGGKSQMYELMGMTTCVCVCMCMCVCVFVNS
jgi:hypothetical protein